MGLNHDISSLMARYKAVYRIDAARPRRQRFEIIARELTRDTLKETCQFWNPAAFLSQQMSLVFAS